MKDDYQRLYDDFVWHIPEHYNFGFDVVDRWANDRTKLALLSLFGDGSEARYQTFYDLKVLTNQFANVLRNLGLGKGDKVFIMLQSIPEWYTAMIGMIKLGVVSMPATVLLTPKDIDYRLNKGEAKMVITDLSHSDDVDAVRAKCPSVDHYMLVDGEKDGWLNFSQEMAKASNKLHRKDVEATRTTDPLIIYFTSGTTGNPKMVLHTHSYPLGHEVTARFAQSLSETDLHWTISETGWAKAAWGKLFGQMIVGAAIIQWETPQRFSPEGVLDAMERYGVTSFCAPPTVYRMMVQLDLSKYELDLRHCMSAGEPLNPEVIKIWKDIYGLDIHDFFGQTETVCVLSNYSFMPIKYGSVGKPTPGHDVRIVDDDGNEMPAGETGHIAINIATERPPGLFQEYWKSPDAMAASFKGDYYYTGDKAYRDEDGYFWFVGRDDDVIKSSGYRIGPFEVESALVEHPAVVESAVVGVPDPDPEGIRGTLVKAFIVLAEGFEPSPELEKELKDHVKNTTAPYKYPRLIEFRKELPKTISGKILRRELRKENS